MFGLAARVVAFGVGAAAVSATTFYAKHKLQRRKHERSMGTVCELCDKALSGDIKSMKCCCAKFHVDCLRAYIQSLDGCQIKCPVKECRKVVIFGDGELNNLEVPIPMEKIYYCHNCELLVFDTHPRVLPCTHRFCAGCIQQCLTANVELMGEEPTCPMEGCGLLLSKELCDSIVRLE